MFNEVHRFPCNPVLLEVVATLTLHIIIILYTHLPEGFCASLVIIIEVRSYMSNDKQ